MYPYWSTCIFHMATLHTIHHSILCHFIRYTFILLFLHTNDITLHSVMKSLSNILMHVIIRKMFQVKDGRHMEVCSYLIA